MFCTSRHNIYNNFYAIFVILILYHRLAVSQSCALGTVCIIIMKKKKTEETKP